LTVWRLWSFGFLGSPRSSDLELRSSQLVASSLPPSPSPVVWHTHVGLDGRVDSFYILPSRPMNAINQSPFTLWWIFLFISLSVCLTFLSNLHVDSYKTIFM
jgi:hypothetical protein